MVLLNFDIHNFLKENNLGISQQNIAKDIFKFIQPKNSEDVDVKHAVQQLVYLYQRKWKSVNYTVKSFEKKFVNWHNEYFIVRKAVDEPTTSRCGRKQVIFNDTSNKTNKVFF